MIVRRKTCMSREVEMVRIVSDIEKGRAERKNR